MRHSGSNFKNLDIFFIFFVISVVGFLLDRLLLGGLLLGRLLLGSSGSGSSGSSSGLLLGLAAGHTTDGRLPSLLLEVDLLRDGEGKVLVALAAVDGEGRELAHGLLLMAAVDTAHGRRPAILLEVALGTDRVNELAVAGLALDLLRLRAATATATAAAASLCRLPLLAAVEAARWQREALLGVEGLLMVAEVEVAGTGRAVAELAVHHLLGLRSLLGGRHCGLLGCRGVLSGGLLAQDGELLGDVATLDGLRLRGRERGLLCNDELLEGEGRHFVE